ncbi:MAG TPA: hypothetical protein VFY13_02115 [Luteolibacter sp.]|nr:hypothetical protein [Luteolibacter sp.]
MQSRQMIWGALAFACRMEFGGLAFAIGGHGLDGAIIGQKILTSSFNPIISIFNLKHVDREYPELSSVSYQKND